MADDPTKYVVSYDFSTWQANNPSKPLPGNEIDVQYADIAFSIGSTVDALADVRRADGALKNGLVTLESLAPELAAQVGDGMLASETAAAASAAAALVSEIAADASADAAAASAAVAAAVTPNLNGTSSTSNVLGAGSKSFTTQAGKYFGVGASLIISSASSPTTRYMTGIVTAYSDTSLTVNVIAFVGTGTYTDWQIAVAGVQGAKGDQGLAGAGTGDMLKSENLSGLTNVATARGNLGLGTAAVVDTINESNMATNSSTRPPTQASVKSYVDTGLAGKATTAQGAKADTAVQPAALSAAIAGVTVANSTVRVGTSNGAGSTNIAIRRFTTTHESVGSDITYADSATLGATFTINTTGRYSISYTDSFATAGGFGISRNSNQLSTSIAVITAAHQLCMGTTANNSYRDNCSITVFLTAGDVIRPHLDGTSTNGTSPADTRFTITRVA